MVARRILLPVSDRSRGPFEPICNHKDAFRSRYDWVETVRKPVLCPVSRTGQNESVDGESSWGQIRSAFTVTRAPGSRCSTMSAAMLQLLFQTKWQFLRGRDEAKPPSVIRC